MTLSVRLRALAIAACAAFPLAAGCAPDTAPPPADGAGALEPPVLSVTGAGGRTPVETGLFDKYALAGVAQTFSFADIAALPRSEMTTDYPLGDTPQTWTGPQLSAVLAAAGAPGSGARLTAYDGYQVEVSAEDIARFEPVLAHAVDGRGLVTGELGPFILVWPRGEDPELDDMNDDLWVWGVFVIEAF
ncbi:hypothetical protein F1654_10350 [Alkalicaulis satelles]|uniref:Molybdopterin-dependent oxidoreductase n=1 Tax=Alkalicaulis satelles TaxID=2609175 RepID=A0A5M6ZDE2_9PROT|nr:hypothetical protein [Alkalicaulis satelles]KAA5802230.1 hypothetical protein F1654_10350 [Alkalicaulis satelles]